MFKPNSGMKGLITIFFIINVCSIVRIKRPSGQSEHAETLIP